MKRHLVFIHGRSQEHKSASALKAEWLESLGVGLAKSNLRLPIPPEQVHFPYYGDTLFDLDGGKSGGEVAQIIVRGNTDDQAEQRFARDVLADILAETLRQGLITDAEVAAVAGQDVIVRGPLNWPATLAVLKAMDRYVPFASGASIALFTHDVHLYLSNVGVREEIDRGVTSALPPGAETVVVSHSLGTVVAYHLLRRLNNAHCQIPLLVTLGSPLGVGPIRRALLAELPPLRFPGGVGFWFNALDPRDVVALYPLDAAHFAVEPATPPILNKCDVSNRTSNRHGISGYLEDPEVARRIYEALA